MSAISLRRNVLWMFIGNSTYAFMQWVQLSLITKFCSIQILGSYTLALAITAPIFLFLGFQLRALLVTDSNREWTFSSYFILRAIMMFIALSIVITYSLISKSGFTVLLLVAILKMIEGFAEIFNSQQQLCEKMNKVAISLILKGISATIALFIGLYIYDSITIGLTFAIIFNIIILFFNDYLNCKKLLGNKVIIKIHNLRLKALFVKALPLGFVMCIISLNTNVSKYIVEYFLGTETQGVYSTLAYCLVFGNFVNSAIGQSFTPRMSRFYAESMKSKFLNLSKKFIFINLGLGFLLYWGAVIGGKLFLRIMFSEEISQYYDLFSLIMLSGIFLYTASALGYTLTSMRIFKIQPFINGTVFIVNSISCYFLINRYGIYGVVYSSIIAFSIQSLFTIYIIKKNI